MCEIHSELPIIYNSDDNCGCVRALLVDAGQSRS